MFVLNDDMSIYATRGDIVFFSVSAEQDGVPYHFQPGDVLRIKIFGKKDAETVVLEKDFPVLGNAENVEIFLSSEDTKIGDVISKPKDYWYEVELNPLTNPQTIIGYSEDGPAVFKLFPEGADIESYEPDPEDFPVVDEELDITSPRPVANMAIAKAIEIIRRDSKKDYVTPQMFGAVGDGVADDSESVSESILAVPDGGVLYLANGKYLFGKTVNVRKNITIKADNATITGYGFRVDSANVKFSGITFKDIIYNAIEVSEDLSEAIVEKCVFDNIGTSSELNPSYQGCGIHAGWMCVAKVYDSEFLKCHGHGAIFHHDGLSIEVKNCRFVDNFYRAICIYGRNEVNGAISGNYIADCGASNETGSGVGCNGIYSTNGYGVVCENNIILNSVENAIEGYFLKIVGNYIDGTGVDSEKPTPSNDGIYVAPSAPAYVVNNIILNAGGCGIKSYGDVAMTDQKYIANNIIRGSGSNAIDINAPSVSNVHIINNVVDSMVNMQNCNDTDIYIGDISLMSGRPNITCNSPVFDLHHYFKTIEPFTYTNCTPTVVTDDGASCVKIPYQEYSKLVYSLPYFRANRHWLDVAVCGKGNFSVSLQKNNEYFMSILAINSDSYVEKHYSVLFEGTISDHFKIYIENNSDSYIKTVDIRVYEGVY